MKTLLVFFIVCSLMTSIAFAPSHPEYIGFDPPLKQIAQGISPNEVICNEGLQLIMRNGDSSACVRMETAIKLEERGWGVMPPDVTSITSFEECIAAGNPTMESYPRQCRTVDGKHFVEVLDNDHTKNEQFEQHFTELPECDDQTFTVSIVDMNNLEYIFPLGGISPPGHTLPTEHMYFGINEEVPLVAPADVYIVDVSGSKNLDKKDRGIRFALCKDVFGYFGHLSTLSEEIREAVKDIDCAGWYTESNDLCSRELQYKVKAGTVLGTVGAHHGQVDFGAYDYRTMLDYANPSRYGIPYFIEQGKVKGWSVVCPIELYDDPLRQQLYEKVSGGIDPTCGEVMQDIKGTLQGNWFIGDVEGDWENSIAFVHDNRNPSKILISIDGGFTDPGKYEFVPETTGFFNRNFSDVTADENIYCYEGEDPNRMGEEKPKGKIIVELVSDTELKIEFQNGDCPSYGETEFQNPTTYYR